MINSHHDWFKRLRKLLWKKEDSSGPKTIIASSDHDAFLPVTPEIEIPVAKPPIAVSSYCTYTLVCFATADACCKALDFPIEGLFMDTEGHFHFP